jgi:hypothetical protein
MVAAERIKLPATGSGRHFLALVSPLAIQSGLQGIVKQKEAAVSVLSNDSGEAALATIYICSLRKH